MSNWFAIYVCVAEDPHKGYGSPHITEIPNSATVLYGNARSVLWMLFN